MSQPIPLTEAEVTRLILESEGNFLPLSFGSEVCLLVRPEATWAMEKIAAWRGIALEPKE